jgi:hypothetical protein
LAGEETDEFVVGFAFFGGRGDANLDGSVVEGVGPGGAGGFGGDFECENEGVLRVEAVEKVARELHQG